MYSLDFHLNIYLSIIVGLSGKRDLKDIFARGILVY